MTADTGRLEMTRPCDYSRYTVSSTALGMSNAGNPSNRAPIVYRSRLLSRARLRRVVLRTAYP